jgi:hypothetical protein
MTNVAFDVNKFRFFQALQPELLDDGKTQQSWHQFLVESVAAAIPQCA